MTVPIDIAEDGVYCRAHGIGYHVEEQAGAWCVVKVQPVKGAAEQDIWEAVGRAASGCAATGTSYIGPEGRDLSLDRCAALLMADLREQGR